MSVKDDYCMVYWTAGSLDEARKVSRYLVQTHYVACANIIPWVESIYTFDDQLKVEQEVKVIFKTKSSQLEGVKEVILSNSSYEVPEISMLKIEAGNEAYFSWMDEAISISHS